MRLCLFVFLVCFHGVALADAIDFSALSKEAKAGGSLSKSEELGNLIISKDQDIVESEKKAVLAQMKDRQQYFSDIAKLRRSEWESRIEYFHWQLLSSQLIFVVFVVFVMSGLYFSYLQFRQKIMVTDSDNNSAEILDKDGKAANIKVSKDGVEVSSPVVGLIILAMSIFMFYIYVKEVYPLQEIDTAKTPSSESE